MQVLKKICDITDSVECSTSDFSLREFQCFEFVKSEAVPFGIGMIRVSMTSY